MSILEIKRYLIALINRLEERKNSYPAKIKSFNNLLNKQKAEYLEIHDSFNSHGIFGKLVGKREEDFNKYVVAKKGYFEAKINIEGFVISALAKEILCLCPPDKPTPRSPTIVS